MLLEGNGVLHEALEASGRSGSSSLWRGGMAVCDPPGPGWQLGQTVPGLASCLCDLDLELRP